jgi:hypothetical protein
MVMAEHADQVDENTVQSGQPENEKITGQLILAFIVSTTDLYSNICNQMGPRLTSCLCRP